MYNDFIIDITKQTGAVSQKGFGTILILDHQNDIPYEVITDISQLKDLYPKEEAEYTDKNIEELKQIAEGKEIDIPEGTKKDDIIALLEEADELVEPKSYKIASRLFGQSPKPTEVAIAGKKMSKAKEFTDFLDEVEDVNNDWFMLTCTDNSNPVIKALAEWIETKEKMYYATTQDLNRGEDGKYTSIIEELEYEKSVVAYHNMKDSYFSEGLAVIMSHDIGSKTGKFKAVNGVTESDASMSAINFLHENGSFTYKRKLGLLQTTEGIATNGEYIDVVLGEAWIKATMGQEAMQLAVNTDKIGYSNIGIGSLVSIAESVLNRAAGMNIVLTEDKLPVYEIDYKDRNEVSSIDVANRDYSDIKWSATLEGAIHGGTISGTLRY